MHELFQIRGQEAELDGEINREIQVDQYRWGPATDHIVGEEDRGRQHANGDRQAIGRFHMGGALEIQDDAGAAEEQQKIDRRNIRLPPFFGGIADPQLGPQVQAHALADQRKGAGDQGLAGNDGCTGGNDKTGYHKPTGHHGIEWIAEGGIEYPAPVLRQQPGPLTEIVQDQAGLNIDPGDPDISAPAMPQVGIEGLGARLYTEKQPPGARTPSGR